MTIDNVQVRQIMKTMRILPYLAILLLVGCSKIEQHYEKKARNEARMYIGFIDDAKSLPRLTNKHIPYLLEAFKDPEELPKFRESAAFTLITHYKDRETFHLIFEASLQSTEASRIFIEAFLSGAFFYKDKYVTYLTENDLDMLRNFLRDYASNDKNFYENQNTVLSMAEFLDDKKLLSELYQRMDFFAEYFPWEGYLAHIKEEDYEKINQILSDTNQPSWAKFQSAGIALKLKNERAFDLVVNAMQKHDFASNKEIYILVSDYMYDLEFFTGDQIQILAELLKKDLKNPDAYKYDEFTHCIFMVDELMDDEMKQILESNLNGIKNPQVKTYVEESLNIYKEKMKQKPTE